MKNYKKWTPAERQKSARMSKKAVAEGIIKGKDTGVCNRCGQNQGIVSRHNSDYDVTLEILGAYYNRKPRLPIPPDKLKKVHDVLEELCWRCHQIHHLEHVTPDECAQYWKEIESGKVYPPVYKHDWNKLAVHGIYERTSK